LRRRKEDIRKVINVKRNIIKSVKAKSRNIFDENSNSENNRKNDLNFFLKERFIYKKQTIEKENICKEAEEKKIVLENEIKTVEKLRDAFTNLLPKVLESIKVIEGSEADERNLTSKNNLNTNNNLKDIRFLESEIQKNTNINVNTYNTNSNSRQNNNNNPITTNSRNRNSSSSKNNSNKNVHNTLLKKYSNRLLEQMYDQHDIFYHPNKNYLIKNKYKKILQ